MSYESPASVLFDVNGIAMAITGGFVVPVSTSALLMAGMTSTGTGSYFKTTDDGTLFITGTLATVASGVQQVTGTVAIQGITNVSGAFPVFISASNLLTVTGSVTVPNLVTVTGSVSVLNPVTVNQGNAGTAAQSWFTKITDGTNTLGTGSSLPLFVETAVHTGSSITAVARTASVVALIPSSSQTRRGVTIYNDSAANMFVLYGSGTVNQTTNYSIRVGSQAYLEVPDNFNGPIYTVWQSAGTGNALVTEFFP